MDEMLPHAHLAIIEVERAAQDLRRGLPVTIGNGRVAALALACETVRADALTFLRAHGGESGNGAHVILTHGRAATLKIRLYTPDIVALPLEDGWTACGLRALADPARDLDSPLKGPFNARREPLPLPAAEAVRLAKIAGLLPAIVIAPLMAPARDLAAAHRLSAVEAAAVASYDLDLAETLELVTTARLPLEGAPDTRMAAFRSPAGGPEHYALIIGDPDVARPVLARVHSECFTGDLLGSLKCDCGDQLRGAIAEIAKAGGGVLLYLAQEGRGIGLFNKLRAYRLQDLGHDTVEANERLGFAVDERFFQPAAEMLRKLNIARVRLLTNNPDKVEALTRLGVEVAERVPHHFPANDHNRLYLRAKAEKTGHLL
jgi:GTP cyclohydrolase II